MFHSLLQAFDGSLVLDLIGVFMAPYASVISLIIALSVGFIVLGYVVSLRK